MMLKIERPIINKLNIITNSMKTTNTDVKNVNVKNIKPKLPSLIISKYAYDTKDNYKEYFKSIGNKEICIELCKIDDIINDDKYWNDNKEIIHLNIFNEVYNYSKTALISYKNMLMTCSQQIII